MKKTGIWALLTLLVVGIVIYYFWQQYGTKASKTQPDTPVTVIKVYKDMIFDSVEALGTTYANESVDITTNITETIREIRFDDGQEVKQGDIIAVLEQSEEEAQLAAAKAQLAEHQRELKRIDSLVKQKAAAKRDYDERRTQLEVTEQQIKEITARMEDRTLRAPFDGVLGVRRLSMGALVQPGQLITTIDDIHQIKLDFNVASTYLTQLQVGTPIEAISSELGGKVFNGTIQTINSRIDPVTRSVLVRALIPNPDGLLKPGLLMRVVLLKDQRRALIVPEDAIIQKQDAHFVLTVDPEKNTVAQRKITLGTRRPGIAEVKEGLEEGELVIVRGVGRVRPDQKVSLQEVWDKIRAPNSGAAATEE